MKYLLIFLLSLACFGFSGFPQFHYGDIVTSSVPGGQEHYFYKCPDQGIVRDFKDEGKINCAFKYKIEFTCMHHEDHVVAFTVTEWRCDKYLKKVKKK